MKSKFSISLLSLIVAIAVTAGVGVGCSLFKPTPQGTCPTLTVNGAELIAFGATTAAIKNGAPAATITLIESNITATVQTGVFNADLIAIAIKNAPQGNQWMPYLGAIDVVFGQAFNSLVATQANQQVCMVPIANAIVAGMQLAQTLSPSASGGLKAASPAAVEKAKARLQYLLRQSNK